jgi:hypothetical protein
LNKKRQYFRQIVRRKYFENCKIGPLSSSGLSRAWNARGNAPSEQSSRFNSALIDIQTEQAEVMPNNIITRY